MMHLLIILLLSDVLVSYLVCGGGSSSSFVVFYIVEVACAAATDFAKDILVVACHTWRWMWKGKVERAGDVGWKC